MVCCSLEVEDSSSTSTISTGMQQYQLRMSSVARTRAHFATARSLKGKLHSSWLGHGPTSQSQMSFILRCWHVCRAICYVYAQIHNPDDIRTPSIQILHYIVTIPNTCATSI